MSDCCYDEEDVPKTAGEWEAWYRWAAASRMRWHDYAHKVKEERDEARRAAAGLLILLRHPDIDREACISPWERDYPWLKERR